jgi:hypothetical protein
MLLWVKSSWVKDDLFWISSLLTASQSEMIVPYIMDIFMGDVRYQFITLILST